MEQAADEEEAAEQATESDNDDVQFYKTESINKEEFIDCKSLNIENILRLFDQSESESGSNCANGNSGSEYEFNNFTGEEDAYSQYSRSESRRLETACLDQLYNNETDDDNDIKISAIQNNLRILSIDN